MTMHEYFQTICTTIGEIVTALLRSIRGKNSNEPLMMIFYQLKGMKRMDKNTLYIVFQVEYRRYFIIPGRGIQKIL